MLNLRVYSDSGLLVYYSRIRAKHLTGAYLEADAMLRELLRRVDYPDSHRSHNEVCIDTFGLREIELNQDYRFYNYRSGYSYIFAFTETATNELAPTIY